MKNKTLVFLSIICCFSSIALGQIKKQSILLGGQISYYNSDTRYSVTQPDQKSMSGIFDLSIGKAVKENSIFGFNLSFSPSNYENDYNGVQYVSSKADRYSVGVFYRKYKTLGKGFYFFAEGGASYVSYHETARDTLGVTLETTKQTGGQLFLTPGISYQICKKLQLEILIPSIVTMQYSATKERIATAEATQKQFYFNSSLNSNGGLNYVGIGFHFIL